MQVISQFIISFFFYEDDVDYLIQFIKCIKKIASIYIEVIYNENTNIILYASSFYQTTQMEKFQQKDYRKKREPEYSENETRIVNLLKSNT